LDAAAPTASPRQRRGAALPPPRCGSPGPGISRPSPAWPWSRSSTAPRRRRSHPRQDRPLTDLISEHRALREGGAVHLLASLDGHDVGLLTIELTSPVPRLCPDGQPYIGPTATLPGARGQGVGHALVDTTLTWAHDHGYQWVSVDFDTANPLSRPFWLRAGFRPAGYGVLRLIDGRPTGQPRSADGH
jgi:GNAT superfamily N-acetyltransferase